MSEVLSERNVLRIERRQSASVHMEAALMGYVVALHERMLQLQDDVRTLRERLDQAEAR